MAFARFADSHLYLFPVTLPDGNDGYQCCACSFETALASFYCHDVGAVLEHVERHRSAGHRVPGDTVPRILRWDADLAGGLTV